MYRSPDSDRMNGRGRTYSTERQPRNPSVRARVGGQLLRSSEIDPTQHGALRGEPAPMGAEEGVGKIRKITEGVIRDSRGSFEALEVALEELKEAGMTLGLKKTSKKDRDARGKTVVRKRASKQELDEARQKRLEANAAIDALVCRIYDDINPVDGAGERSVELTAHRRYLVQDSTRAFYRSVLADRDGEHGGIPDGVDDWAPEIDARTLAANDYTR